MSCLPRFFTSSRRKEKRVAQPPPPYSPCSIPYAPEKKKNKFGKKLFLGRVVHSKSLKQLDIERRAAVGVDEAGTICFFDNSIGSIAEARERYPEFSHATVIELGPLQFLFPGLIDTHMHAPQYPNMALGMEGNLKEWCEGYTDPIEASYKNTDKARRVYREMVRKELENGSTTVAYNSSIHPEATNVLADTCKEYGQRAIVGKLCIVMNSTHGNWEASAEQSLKDEKRVVDYIRHIDPVAKLISPCVQPRAGSYASPLLMEGLGKMCSAASGLLPLHVQAHMCETLSEVAGMRKVHGNFESYADMYDSYGLLHQRSILAHCIHLSDRDMNLLAERNAGVAHNPNSNTCLTDGECRVRELLNRGINVGLGTDCSAGYSISILDAMRQASNVSRHLVIHTGDESLKLGFAELVFLATLGGAQVCAMEDKIGNFEPGKMFDALIVDVGQEDNINVHGFEDDDLALVKKWVFMGDDRSIRLVYVNGILVAGKDMTK